MIKSIDIAFKDFMAYFTIFKINNRIIFMKSSSKYIFDRFLFSQMTEIDSNFVENSFLIAQDQLKLLRT